MAKTKVYILQSSSNIIKALNRKNQSYIIEFTNNTTAIKTEQEGQKIKYLCSDRNLPVTQLAFIQKVKSYVEKTGRPKVEVKASEVGYFKFADLAPGFYENVSELDVNKAYWEIACQKGYLSKDIYTEGLKVDKMTRLIAWGAIAASKRAYSITPEGKEFLGEECNEVTRSYFFDVARELGFEMSEILANHSKSVLFYWVDAFFIQGRSTPAVIEKEMRMKGLPCKTVPLWHINVEEKNEFTDLITVTEKGGKEKPFHRKKGNRQVFQFQEYLHTLEAANGKQYEL